MGSRAMKLALHVCVLALIACVTTQAAEATKKKNPREKAARATTSEVVDSTQAQFAAESKLIEIYQLIAQARTREALAKAQALARAQPNFQLAQLVYGDLLSSQLKPLRTLGDVPEPTAKAYAEQLSSLREESQLRLKALRERPPAGMIPSQFLSLSAQSRYAIAVDTSRARLYLFKNTRQGLELLTDYYISVGKYGIGKTLEGDQRTPLGVYYTMGEIDPKSLTDFYGAGALPLNYPNAWDVQSGRTGNGIWLHGTPSNQYARPPRATNGCVVLTNPDLQGLMTKLQARPTPVVIAKQLQWVPAQSLQAQRSQFEAVLRSWRLARATGDLATLQSHYVSAALANKSLDRGASNSHSRSTATPSEVKNFNLLRWQEGTDIIVATYNESTPGQKLVRLKQQYWSQQHGTWKIFYEGFLK